MSKKLNTGSIVNELHQSKFFARSRSEHKEKPQPLEDEGVAEEVVHGRSTQQDEKVAPERGERSQRSEPFAPKDDEDTRELKRFSHDLYIDQMETLTTKVRSHFMSKGVEKSKAQMIREAIDEYIRRYS